MPDNQLHLILHMVTNYCHHIVRSGPLNLFMSEPVLTLKIQLQHIVKWSSIDL